MLGYLPLLLEGTKATIQIAVAAAVLAFFLAVPFGLGRISPLKPLRLLSGVYVELFRGTSLLVQLFWLYFVLPQFGLTLPPMAVAVLGIGLNYGAYGAEIVRGAVLAVPTCQWEAARSLSLRRWPTLRLVILPQALPLFVRPWGNLLIQLLKATSLVSLITIAELAFRAYQLNQLTLRTAEIFGAVLLIYFGMAQAIAFATNIADRRVGRWRRVRVMR